MARDRYMAQVRLLTRILPLIADDPVFALKGGTAINLFHRDMPRLSVDADLVYLPLQDRQATLAGIDAALQGLAHRVEQHLRGARVHAAGRTDEVRVEIRHDNAAVKVETSPVMRGTVHPPETRRVTKRVEDEFGFAELTLVAFEDLFAGKLVAALDRQHPRDLHDIKLLFENEGITDELYRTFLVYVASSNRPLHELFTPRPVDMEPVFHVEFAGMTVDPVTLTELESARGRLVTEIRARLDSNSMRFLLSLHDGAPDFDAIGLPQAAALPAVRWKVLNLERLRSTDPEKHARQRAAIEELSGGARPEPA